MLEQDRFKKVELIKKAYRIKKYDDLNLALAWNKEAVSLAKANGVDSLIGYVVNDLGIIYGRLGRVDSTLYYYEKSRDIHLSYGSNLMAAVSNSNIGLVYAAKGEFSKALKSYSEAIKVFEEENAEKYLCGTYRNLGNLYMKYKLYDKAKDNFNLSGALAKKLDQKVDLALAHYTLGDLYQQIGECAESLKEGKIANKLFTELKQPLNIARSNRRIGTAYRCSGDYKQSLVYYDKALEYFGKTKKRNYYQILVAKANSYFDLGNYVKSREIAKEALNGLDTQRRAC